MQKLNQQFESQLFNQKHAMEIADAEALLFAKAVELLDCDGRKALQPGTIQNVTDAIHRKQLSRLHSILRQQASCFSRVGSTDRYWAWIDATSHLLDATGTQWPYFTQDERTRSLSWVSCTLEERFIQAA